jgi:hypothetical protein
MALPADFVQHVKSMADIARVIGETLANQSRDCKGATAQPSC